MKKRITLAAVTSAAALLTTGGSFTSFAAAGWAEEDGAWYYYNSDGSRAEDEWKKSGDNWYWLDSGENGAMAVEKLIVDEENIYYVDDSGAMVKNTWVTVKNEDFDEDEDPAEYHYYYMQSNGRAYRQTGSKLSKKTINGRKYAFDEEGRMLYGWVSEDGERKNGEDEWADAEYYFGGWNDGSMKTGWQKITVHDEENGKNDNYDYWFHFRSNGRKRTHGESAEDGRDQTWKSGGKYYHFDYRGVMVYQWFLASDDGTASEAKSWAYFNSPEDGARVTKGWFKVVPPNEDNSFYESDDTFGSTDPESELWYYADGDGEPAVGEIRKIKGRYYGFYPNSGKKGGQMLSGLYALRMNETDGSVIDEVISINHTAMSKMDTDKLQDFIDEYEKISAEETGIYLYYFATSRDDDVLGSMKTGKVTLDLSGGSCEFYFKKTGGADSRGRSVNGIDEGDFIYQYGRKVKADADDKYICVYADGDKNDEESIVIVYDSEDIMKTTETESCIAEAELRRSKGYDDDGHPILYITGFHENMYLVNTSGRIQTGKKSGIPDGRDWYWYLKKEKGKSTGKGNIVAYANSRKLNECDELLEEFGVTRWDEIEIAKDESR